MSNTQSETAQETVTGAGQSSTPRRRRRLQLPSAVTVAQLAELMGISPIDVIKQFMRNGIMAAMNQVVDFDTASIVCQDFGFAPVRSRAAKEGALQQAGMVEDDLSQLVLRPPAVTILGHVDHGKTTLLDAIRESNIIASEVGGITQHIGAYQVEYNGQKITFVDTPGHEAFTAMRARGAQVTDIAVLVVAADDGVMPQTVEAIAHAKAAGVPIVVAINKIDKPGADIERVKRQLAEHDLLIEEWGGDVVVAPVSAKERVGIEDLLENILVVAEVAELKANPNRPAQGVVVEAQLDKSRGPMATVLVQNGTLRVGDNVVVGSAYGRVKAMFNDTGKRVKSAGPAFPAEVLGLNELPQAGDTLEAVENEKAARALAEEHKTRLEAQRATRTPHLEEVYARIRTGEVKALNLVLKTDVQGTIDAVKSSLEQLATAQVKLNLIHASSGSITEGDILLALASGAIVISFGARPEPGALRLAEVERVEIRHYAIIYELIDDVRKALEGLLEPAYEDVLDGRAEVRAVFTPAHRGKVAGVYVTEGKAPRSSHVRVLRGGKPLYDGPVASLKHFKDDVRELANGFEGGVGLEDFQDFQEGDVLEFHHREQASK